MQEIWIAPTNPKYFDVIEYLKTNKELAIKSNQKKVNVGDIVYIYIAAPISQIKYKGTVIKNECDAETLNDHNYVFDINNDIKTSFFLVEIDTEFVEGTFPYTILKEKGIGQVQILARASRTIKAFIKELEKDQSYIV